MTDINNTPSTILKTPISFFRDSESVDLINKALLSYQSKLNSILIQASHSNIKTHDEKYIKQTIQKIDEILDTIELYSS